RRRGSCRYDPRPMESLTQAVIHYGLPLIFGIVLLEQIGLPIPAMPFLVVGGALAVDGDFSAPRMLGLAVVASVLAHSLWYWLGLRQGKRVLEVLCPVSPPPGPCGRPHASLL